MAADDDPDVEEPDEDDEDQDDETVDDDEDEDDDGTVTVLRGPRATDWLNYITRSTNGKTARKRAGTTTKRAARTRKTPARKATPRRKGYFG